MKALFVGGHWHGRVVDVPDGLSAFRVPVPVSIEPGSLAFALGLDVEPEIQVYQRERFWFGAGEITAFVLGPPAGDSVYVADALAIAAGLDVRR